MNWLTIDEAEQKFFASHSEILALIDESKIETKEIEKGDQRRVFVLEIHMDRHFLRRDPSLRIEGIKHDLKIGVGSSIAATAVYELSRSLLQRREPALIQPNPSSDIVGTNEFPRVRFLEGVIQNITDIGNSRLKRSLLASLRRSLDRLELEDTDVALDIVAATHVSASSLVEYKILIGSKDAQEFLQDFGWDEDFILTHNLVSSPEYVAYTMERGTYLSYVEWIAVITNHYEFGSVDIDYRLEHYVDVIDAVLDALS